MPVTYELADPERLKSLAETLALRAQTEPFVEALYAAAAEIETLRYTVKASVDLAQRAAVQSIRDREQMEQVRDKNSEMHNRIVTIRKTLDEHGMKESY